MSKITMERQTGSQSNPGSGKVSMDINDSTGKLRTRENDGTETDYSDVSLTSTAPVNVTKAAAAVGSGDDAARHDHKHDVSTAAPAATGVAASPGEGSATTLARSDHTHQSNTAPANVTKATAAVGSSGEPARADHKHDISTAAASAVGTSNSEGSATSLARSDHDHEVIGIKESGGTGLGIGAISDGQNLVRIGSSLVGSTAAVFGQNYQRQDNAAYSSTTGEDTVRVTLVTGDLTGTYRVGFGCHLRTNNKPCEANLYNSTTTTVLKNFVEKPSTDSDDNGATVYSVVEVTLTGSSNTLQLRYGNISGASDTVGIADAFIEFWRVS